MMLGMTKVVFSILLSGMMAIGRTMESRRLGYGASSLWKVHSSKPWLPVLYSKENDVKRPLSAIPMVSTESNKTKARRISFSERLSSLYLHIIRLVRSVTRRITITTKLKVDRLHLLVEEYLLTYKALIYSRFMLPSEEKKSNSVRSDDRGYHRNRPTCLIQRLDYAISSQSHTVAQKCAGASSCIVIHDYLPFFLVNYRSCSEAIDYSSCAKPVQSVYLLFSTPPGRSSSFLPFHSNLLSALLQFSSARALSQSVPNRTLLSSSLDPGQGSSPSSPEKKNLLNNRGGSTTRPRPFLLAGHKSRSLPPSSYLHITHQYTPGPSGPRRHNSLSNFWTHLSITPPVSIIPFSRHRPWRQDSFKTGFTYCQLGAGSPLPLWLPVWVSSLPEFKQ
ncbi:hypothetical protein TNCV_4891321 [Trichonephila clavipes]|nr:hypothetical protein TNCV_4891321 [Trichonephila clavipes]